MIMSKKILMIIFWKIATKKKVIIKKKNLALKIMKKIMTVKEKKA